MQPSCFGVTTTSANLGPCANFLWQDLPNAAWFALADERFDGASASAQVVDLR